MKKKATTPKTKPTAKTAPTVETTETPAGMPAESVETAATTKILDQLAAERAA